MADLSGIDAGFNGQIFRKDFPIVIAANRHLAVMHPVRLLADASGYTAGQVLKRRQSDGVYLKNSVSATGCDDANAVLFQSVGGDASIQALAVGIFSGELYKGALIDSDSGFLATGKTITPADGVAIFKF